MHLTSCQGIGKLSLMPLKYREDRTTQAVGHLLRLYGAPMPYIKLLKLLYLADRRALLELGHPISFDLFVSMPHGPVLSRTYSLISGDPESEEGSYWYRYITRQDYDVRLLEPTPNDQLSAAEEQILQAIFDEYGSWSKWRLRDFTHTLPEWHDPEGSSVPIPIFEILTSQGVSEDDARAIEGELALTHFAQSVLG